MTSYEIRSRFLAFFEKRGHAILPSASLLTSDEKGATNSTLFNTAGMQPLIPYLLGKPHPKGKRLADAQKCVRTVDIDDIGDKIHATFFEMLGNWSLGDYFKKEAIEWSYEFLTNSIDAREGDRGLGLDPRRLYVTVFEGDMNAPKDEAVADIWKKIFKENKIEGNRIFYLPAKNNWWEAGDDGPCGPDTEMFYDVYGTHGGKGLTHEEFLKADEERSIVEIWNDVFMQYEKKNGKIIGKLAKPSVDTGAGLERLAMVMQGVDSVFDTDLFTEIMKVTRILSLSVKSQRIIADHIRTAVFLISDGVIPSNTNRGHVLRRLIRRAIFNTTDRKLSKESIHNLVSAIASKYLDVYADISDNTKKIKEELFKESQKFETALKDGLKEFEKGTDAFTLFASYGFPLELTLELAKEKGIKIDTEKFNQAFAKHQALSRARARQKFKGGLADTSEMSVKYHTVTHLLHQALHDVLGEGVAQKGSNITPERLRFDFSHSAKMTDEEKKKVEEIVNEKIKENLPVQNVILPRAEAEKTGARHFFAEKYGDKVSIYFIGKNLEQAYSKEFCGGPHMANTGDLAVTTGGKKKLHFKIQKEEAVSQGVRRIKATLE